MCMPPPSWRHPLPCWCHGDDRRTDPPHAKHALHSFNRVRSSEWHLLPTMCDYLLQEQWQSEALPSLVLGLGLTRQHCVSLQPHWHTALVPLQLRAYSTCFFHTNCSTLLPQLATGQRIHGVPPAASTPHGAQLPSRPPASRFHASGSCASNWLAWRFAASSASGRLCTARSRDSTPSGGAACNGSSQSRARSAGFSSFASCAGTSLSVPCRSCSAVLP